MWTVKTLAIFLMLLASALTHIPIIDEEIDVAEDGSCPPGYFRLNSKICRPCPPGTFMEDYNMAPRCHEFRRECLPTEDLTLERSSRHDTQCMCKRGMQRTYHNVVPHGITYTYLYFECTPCPEGHEATWVRGQLQYGDTHCCPPHTTAVRRGSQIECESTDYGHDAITSRPRAAQSEKTPPKPPVPHIAGTAAPSLTNPEQPEAGHPGGDTAEVVARRVVGALAGLLFLCLLLCSAAVRYGLKHPQSICGRVYRRLRRYGDDSTVRYARGRYE